MNLFDSAARAMGSLRSLTNDELAEQREALRIRHTSNEDHFEELHRYDNEIARREAQAYERENPNPPARVHREHGWYLSNGD